MTPKKETQTCIASSCSQMGSQLPRPIPVSYQVTGASPNNYTSPMRDSGSPLPFVVLHSSSCQKTVSTFKWNVLNHLSPFLLPIVSVYIPENYYNCPPHLGDSLSSGCCHLNCISSYLLLGMSLNISGKPSLLWVVPSSSGITECTLEMPLCSLQRRQGQVGARFGWDEARHWIQILTSSVRY